MDQVIKVLIVDDSKSQCLVLKNLLQHFGIAVVDFCHDGEAALTILSKSKKDYDAIFVDLHMQGMDGLELIHQLHNNQYRGAVVVISALDTRIVDYTMEVISKYKLRLLGSIEKPIERSIVAFMVRRIKREKRTPIAFEKLPKRREISEALKNDQLQVYFQPIINGHTNEVHAIECLSRMELKGYERLMPGTFIPIIEKFGMLDLFIEKLVAAVSPAYKQIFQQTGTRPQLNINISPQQLFNDELPNTLAHLFDDQLIDKTSVCLEITENYALTEEQQQKNLSRLRIQGFKLALDDYGSGYTNLHQITNMPLNSIKIDAELINGMHKDKALRVIVDSLYKIAEELKLELVAEGIANPHDLIMLDEIGIHFFQGYFFARPKPATEFIRWYGNWKKTMDSSMAFDQRVIERNK